MDRKEKNLLPLQSFLLLLNFQKLSLLPLPFGLSMNALHGFLPLPDIMTHHISNYITFIPTDIHSYRRQIGAARVWVSDWMGEYAKCVLMSQFYFCVHFLHFYNKNAWNKKSIKFMLYYKKNCLFKQWGSKVWDQCRKYNRLFYFSIHFKYIISYNIINYLI